jgi:hypothetical protein
MTTTAKAPEVTSRACTCRFKNQWGSPVTDVKVHHWNSDGANNWGNWSSVPQGEATSNDMTINFETGLGSAYDYWQVSFTSGNIKYESKGDFYCNLSSSDEGGIVTASIQSSGFQIAPPDSSGCNTNSIGPASLKRE